MRDAVAVRYRNAATNDQWTRTLAYEQEMEKIFTKYPDDFEAAAFYALAIDQDALPTDRTFASRLKAAAIARGLPYARRYADLAPDARHALQMLWVQGGRNQALMTMAAASTLGDTTEKSAVTPSGVSQKARTYYQRTVKICESGERQIRPELDHAASYVGGTR